MILPNGQKLQKGDIFLSKNPMALGRVINSIQKFYSSDNNSIYSHAGIIVDETGKTLESLWTVTSRDFFKEYQKERVVVARWSKMDEKSFKAGLSKIKKNIGQIYPFWRLVIMTIKPLGKYLTVGRVVCSELVCKFLNGAGEKILWSGMNPDDVHDIVKHWKDWEIVFEGSLKKYEQ